MKRFLLYIFLFFLITSIYKDLTLGTTNDKIISSEKDIEYTVMQVRIMDGDTVYSIVEKINNGNIDHISSEQIIEDFQILNPNRQPDALETNSIYFFPVYQ